MMRLYRMFWGLGGNMGTGGGTGDGLKSRRGWLGKVEKPRLRRDWPAVRYDGMMVFYNNTTEV